MAEETDQAGINLRAQGRKRIERIDAAYKAEERFFDTATRAEEIYANEPGNRSSNADGIGWYSSYDFNILFSNVETIVPAIINSPPVPDIRRRFNDTDPAAKEVSDILERAIRVQIDDSRLQTEMEKMAQDGFLGGRGLIRLRYRSEETEREENKLDDNALKAANADSDDEDAQVDAPEVYNERICFEAVSWRDFRRGPAKRWEDVPWIAFRHAIPRPDIDTFADSNLYASQDLAEDRLGEDNEVDVIFWEYWDRKTKEVWFVEEQSGKVLKKVDDPLGLTCFFPICTPVQPIEINGRLMPVTPFAIYQKLADEVDIVSMRIRFLVKAMKVKALYGGNPVDLASITEGDDADLVPVADPEMWAQQGGLDNMLSWWPIEKFAVAIRELYTARDQAKQAIYEITGISDIVRGASNSGETATAQQIKTQWGSLRIQKMQRMMERAARDLFVLMVEIIPTKFSAQTLQDMTGIQLIPTEQDLAPIQPQIPPMQQGMDPAQAQQMQQQAIRQAQQAEQARVEKVQKLEAVNKLLQDKLQKFYRIDVESDSTVRADLTRQKMEVAEFLQGTAAFWQGMVPAVQSGIMKKGTAAEIFASNARMFNLGKSPEDAIDKMANEAMEADKQPPPPSPEQIEAQSKAQESQARAAADTANAQAAQQTAQAEVLRAQTEAQTASIEVMERQQALQIKDANDRLDINKKHTQAVQEAAFRKEKHDQDMEIGRLQIDKLNVEIGGKLATTEATIDATKTKTASAVVSSAVKDNVAQRSQTLKESQAKEPAK